MEANFFSVFGNLYAASLASATNLYLGLNHDGVSRSVGHFDCGFNVVGDSAWGDGHTESCKLGASLIFEQVQRWSFLGPSRGKRAGYCGLRSANLAILVMCHQPSNSQPLCRTSLCGKRLRFARK